MMTVVFVCTENANRSQMAEACAKLIAPNGFTFYSAGSAASGIINPKAIAAMKAIGYDLKLHESNSIEQLPIQSADYAISMGCGDMCPQFAAKQRLEWNFDDPKHLEQSEYNLVRDQIYLKVKEFITSLREIKM